MIILKGVTIGKDVVIGARSVENKDFPVGRIAVDKPASIIGSVYDS